MIVVSTLGTRTHTVLGETIYPLRSFVSPNLGFQFQYPGVWGEPTGSGSLVSFVIRDPFSRSIDLFIIRIDVFTLNGSGLQESCNCKTLIDFVRWDYDRKFKIDNDVIVLNQTRLVNNYNSWQMKLNSITETGRTEKLLVWTIDGNRGYRFQYSAPEHRFMEYLAGFEHMLNSFKLPEHSEGIKPTCMLFNLICF